MDALKLVAVPTPATVVVDLEDVFRREYAHLVAVVTRMIDDRDRAEELVQDAFERYVHACAAGEQIRRPGAWLTTVACRLALNDRRDRLRRERREVERSAVETEPLGHELDPGLVAAIATLSPMQRGALMLVHGEGRPAGEAAAILGCRPATLRVHLHRARLAMRRELDDRGGPTT
jgi:RNA polymerase sigma-70 factor (ECF subfamily)